MGRILGIDYGKKRIGLAVSDPLKIIAIHAGLECGAIIGKYSHLKAISIGPTINGAHSENESVDVSSVGKLYNFAYKIINEISNPQS